MDCTTATVSYLRSRDSYIQMVERSKSAAYNRGTEWKMVPGATFCLLLVPGLPRCFIAQGEAFSSLRPIFTLCETESFL